jgi:CHAT domain-containing protein
LTEAYSLYKIFSRSKTTIYGIKANKYALKELESNDIIHIITHGFYNEVKESPKTFSKDSLTTQHYISEDPLINSGLVFTNVNDRSEFPNNKFEDAFGDCILSAKEVLSMDLHGTDLLILSACQTALGDHRNGEGIQGLRRAFELAGVNSIICTLWDVSDISSAILMEKFYYNLIKKRMNKAQSLYYAKEYVKKFTNKDTIKYFKKNGFISKADELEEYCEIHESLKQKPFEHPYYWAGYILQGCI